MDDSTHEFLAQRACPVKPAPMKFRVQYKGQALEFEERCVGPRVTLFTECPSCKNLVGTSEPTHEWWYSKESPVETLTVCPSLVCPTEGCKFHVTVKQGVMADCG